MNFYFWQNINSIHQSAFFSALPLLSTDRVHLITTEPLSSFRRDMGWEEPTLEGVNVINQYKSNLHLYEMIKSNSSPDNIHIFSGIAAFPLVHKAFKAALRNRCRIGIFTEPLDFRGKKGTLRKIRGFYHKFLYGRHIEFVLTTGKRGVTQFKNWGYPDNKIFEWAYTVRESTISLHELPNSETSLFKILFAGSLTLRKGCDILIEALQKLESKNFIADFYCLQESEKEKGIQISHKSSLGKILRLLPFLPNNRLREKMNEYDLLILPSRHDGWGTVVNESIMEGTPVIVSSKCGSSTLVTNDKIGRVLTVLDSKTLAYEITSYINKGKVNQQQKSDNRKWAKKHISGIAMAKYFTEIVTYLNSPKTVSKPLNPWQLE